MSEEGANGMEPGGGREAGSVDGAFEGADASAAGGARPTGAGPNPARRPTPAAHSRGFGRWLWEWTKSLAVALVLFFLVRAFVVEAFQIPTASMENTLLVGDFLLVNKMVYGAEIPGTEIHIPGFSEPTRGDVVVFEPPPTAGQPPRTNYVKRIVGTPGDTLQMIEGVLYRNSRRVPEPYVKNGGRSRDLRSSDFSWQRSYLVQGSRHGRYRPTRDNWGPLRVPEHSYFVMGDNRANSQDSRYWGFVPADAIKGKPFIIYYSYDRRRPEPMRFLTEIRWDRILSLVD